MDQFTKEVTFITNKHINSFEDLDAYQEDVEKKRKELIKERSNLYSKIKRCRNEEYKKLYEKDKKALNEQITLLNNEIKNCNGIRESMKEKQKKLESSKEFKQENIKEKNKEKAKW